MSSSKVQLTAIGDQAADTLRKTLQKVRLAAGPKAGDNPWHYNSLEWDCPSPPPHYNFEEIPTVYHGPYEYSVPEEEVDYLPQTKPRPPGAGPIDPIMGDA